MPVRDVRRYLPASGASHALDSPAQDGRRRLRHVDLALLGVIFLPFTTLMYVILWQAGGLNGWDWFWVGLAAVLDIGHWAGSWTQRRQMPGYPAGAQS